MRALAGLEAAGASTSDRKSEAVAAWRRFLEALAERQPLVLVFEDLHWADDALLDFVDHLVDWVTGVPMLVVCTARPELLDRRGGWGGGKRNALTIALSPLADRDVARLIGALLEQAALPAETQVTLLGAAAGNPLYAEEYVRMLIDRGHLLHEGGRWQLVTGADLPVPESVHGLIAARLDDLPAEQKRLLQDAAVLGKVVWLGALASMSGTDRFVVEAHLHALERREMLRRERRSSVGGESEYAFRHVLMRDVAYGQIPRAQRADKHRRAAEWIESMSEDRENAPDMLAHHYSQALDYARDSGQPTDDLARRTRVAFRDAAERAAALNSIAPAERHYLAALSMWPEDDPDWPLLVVATADIGLGPTGDDLTAALGRACVRLEASGDLADAAKAEMLAGFRYWNEAMSDRSTAAFARAGGLLERAEPSPTVALVSTRLAIHTMLRGEYEETIALCERALAIADDGLEDIRSHVLNTRGVSRVIHRGDLEGIADVESSIEIAERLNAAVLIIRGYKNLGSTLAELGELGRAAELERKGADAARRFGVEFQLLWFETELAILAYWEGEWDSAEETFARLDGWVGDVGPHYMEAAAHSCRAKLRAARGDRRGARADMDQALDFARRSNESQLLLPALADAASIAATGVDADAAQHVSDLFEELSAATADGVTGSYWSAEFALALALTNQAERFRGVAAEGPSRWLAVALVIAEERYLEAAEELAAIGARPEEALTRVLAARTLIGQGHRADGEAEVRRAVEFWQRVGASRQAAMAEALLARTA